MKYRELFPLIYVLMITFFPHCYSLTNTRKTVLKYQLSFSYHLHVLRVPNDYQCNVKIKNILRFFKFSTIPLGHDTQTSLYIHTSDSVIKSRNSRVNTLTIPGEFQYRYNRTPVLYQEATVLTGRLV